MALREILIFPDDRLRAETTEVEVFDDELKLLVNDMFETMYAADGIGLAAPQIGLSKKLVVIDVPDTDEEGNVIEQHPLVLVNPKIVEKIGECISKEGCLSLPEYYEEVPRAASVKVEAQDVDGHMHTYEATGLLAICMQHELDHLNGHVFIDYVSSLKRDRITKGLLKKKKERARKAKEEKLA